MLKIEDPTTQEYKDYQKLLKENKREYKAKENLIEITGKDFAKLYNNYVQYLANKK